MKNNQPPKYDPEIHHRKSIRLRGYDYSQAGAYFVTIVTRNRKPLFGEITEGEMTLNEMGRIADECWRAIPVHFPFVELGEHIIMPNHAHGIILIRDAVDGNSRDAALLRPYDDNSNPHKINVKTGSLGAVVRSYKSAVSYQIHKEHKLKNIWQANYYEHIIRNAEDANRIHLYVESNPAQWANDNENPNAES